MKQKAIIDAHRALERLCGERLPLDIALKLANLKRETAKQYEFQLQEERKIYEEYQPVIDGDLAKFESVEKRMGFEADMRKLAELEVCMPVRVVKIPADCGIRITADDVAALYGFVKFGDGEEDGL